MFCPVCYGDDPPEQNSVECLCLVGCVVIFDMRFYLSGAFHAGAGSDRVEFVPNASLFLIYVDQALNGIPMIFLAELCGIDGISVLADFYPCRS